MMADNQLNDDVGGDDIFVYTGGEQQVPRDVKRVRIAENIDTIPARTFYQCRQLTEVEGHNRLNKVEKDAFNNCTSVRRVTKMRGVIEIEEYAFYNCVLSELELFDKLEIIGEGAFFDCKSLKSINMPSIRRSGKNAFADCDSLTDVMFGQDLERMEQYTFYRSSLRRIVIPLKDNLFIGNCAFTYCEDFSRVDTLPGGISRTMSSLHLESWRNEMQGEIDSINQTLRYTQSSKKAGAIQQWITRVLGKMEHYKSEHQVLLKEAMTLLELALWKAKLLDERDEKKCNVDIMTKKAKIDTEAARKEHRVTCGASAVIKNVLPFLELQ
jgi:hypothetical protein